jgi:hypothetical protein
MNIFYSRLSYNFSYELNGREVRIAHRAQTIDFANIRQQVHDKMVVSHIA